MMKSDNGREQFLFLIKHVNILSCLDNSLNIINILNSFIFETCCPNLFLTLYISFGSSCPEVFCKKGVLRNYAKFTGKHLCNSLFLNKVAGLSLQLSQKQDSGAGVFLSIL